MATRSVTLENTGSGFGFTIMGGAPSPILVSKVKAGTPAEAAGLSVGDHIVTINGESTTPLTQFKAVSMIRQAGKVITIEVKASSDDLSKAASSAATSARTTSAKSKSVRNFVAQEGEKYREEIKHSPNTPRRGQPNVMSRVEARTSSAGGATAATKGASAAPPSPKTKPKPPPSPKTKPKPPPSPKTKPKPKPAPAAPAAKSLASEAKAAIAGLSSNPTPAEVKAFAAVVARIEAAATTMESGAASPGPAAAAGGDADKPGAAMLASYDELLAGPVADVVSKSNALSGMGAQLGPKLQAAFTAQRRFLEVVPASSKPGPKVLDQILEATVDAIKSLVSLKDQARGDAMENHVSAVAEGIQALSWINVAPKPAPFVKDMTDAAQFYSNRVLRQGGADADWAKAFVRVLGQLHAHVKEFHTTGLAWGTKMRSMTFWSNALAATAPGEGEADTYQFNSTLGVPTTVAPTPIQPKAGGGAPPPPPPGPPPPPESLLEGTSSGDKEKDSGADVKSALFASLNKGEGVTAGLKKVDRSQMTHKNPALRASSVVSADAIKQKPAAPAAAKKAAPKTVRPPVFKLDGKKWVVENHVGNRELIIPEPELNHTVYVYNCTDCTIVIKGKLNTVTFDSCKKTGVVVDDLISSFEVINCKSVQAQIMGAVPVINLDKTDGAQVFLSEQSKEVEIVTAKCSELNVSIPTSAEGDFIERPVAEQFKTVWDGSKLVTTPTDIAG